MCTCRTVTRRTPVPLRVFAMERNHVERRGYERRNDEYRHRDQERRHEERRHDDRRQDDRRSYDHQHGDERRHDDRSRNSRYDDWPLRPRHDERDERPRDDRRRNEHREPPPRERRDSDRRPEDRNDSPPTSASARRAPERRSSALISQYDSLFEGMDWYHGGPAAAAVAPAGSPPDEGLVESSCDSAAVTDAPAATQPCNIDMAEQKQRLLHEFLNRLGSSDASATPAPPEMPVAKSCIDRCSSSDGSRSSGGDISSSDSSGGISRISGGSSGGSSSSVIIGSNSCSCASCSASSTGDGGGSSTGGSSMSDAATSSPRAALVRSFMSELEATGLVNTSSLTSSEAGVGMQQRFSAVNGTAAHWPQDRVRDMDFWQRETEALEAALARQEAEAERRRRRGSQQK